MKNSNYCNYANARFLWVYIVQTSNLADEIQRLRKEEKWSPRSTIIKLNPKLQSALLKVVGRLSNYLLAENAKHPLTLPASSHFTNLLMSPHYRCLHGGVQRYLL